MAESWESVAHALAERLNHATHLDHNPARPDCPYCSDVLAFRRYTAKRAAVGRPHVDPLAGATYVNLEDLPLSARMELPRG